MKKTIRWELQFFCPGLIVSETWRIPCAPNPDLCKIKWPKTAFAVQVLTTPIAVDLDGTEYVGETKNAGKTYYRPGCIVQTAEEALADRAMSRVDREHITGNGYTHIVKTPSGNKFSFDTSKDEVLVKP
jgi:hypothetical protein